MNLSNFSKWFSANHVAIGGAVWPWVIGFRQHTPPQYQWYYDAALVSGFSLHLFTGVGNLPEGFVSNLIAAYKAPDALAAVEPLPGIGPVSTNTTKVVPENPAP